MDIQVGMYVRTKDGNINKVIKLDLDKNIENGYTLYFVDNIVVCYTKEELDKLKFSKNIIDLLENGDCVNGYPIIYVNYKDKWITILDVDKYRNAGIKVLRDDEIKTTLTKEQYKQNCFEVDK